MENRDRSHLRVPFRSTTWLLNYTERRKEGGDKSTYICSGFPILKPSCLDRQGDCPVAHQIGLSSPCGVCVLQVCVRSAVWGNGSTGWFPWGRRGGRRAPPQRRGPPRSMGEAAPV